MISEQRAWRARIGILIAAASALMLALNDVAVPFAYAQGFSAPTVVFFRFLFQLLSLAIVLPLAGLGFRLSRDHLFHTLGSGFAAGIGTLSLLGSFALIPVSLALIILYTYPILTAVFESVHARRLPRPVEITCLIAALAGVGIIIGLNELKLSPLGLFLGCVSSLSYATSIFWNGIKLRNADGMVVSLYVAIMGIATASLYLVVSGSFSITQAGIVAWLPLLAASFFFSVAFIGLYKAIELAGGASTAMTFNLEPVFVMFLAAILLDEALTFPRLLGGAMVIGSVIVSETWRSRRTGAIELAG
jgi:drug/metabolite transporter (DMT)-like permease